MFAMKINMDTNSLFKKKNKKSLSTVIATVLLILLVTVATTVVWVFVNNIVRNRTEGVQSCFDVESSEKVTINDYYTCYNTTYGEVQFSINIGDADIESLVISILIGGNSKSFSLTNTPTVVQNLKPYHGLYANPVSLPGKNEGKTYVAGGFPGVTKVDWIKIAPVVDGKQCGESDVTLQVESCSSFENN
jgi:hypothetical protein